MVDAAVAAVSHMDGANEIIHLDMSLHTSVLTVIRRDQRWTRHRVEVDDRAGLADVYGRWAKAIAADFLRTTRFDPLHLASTEQSLFDRLPDWLLDLASADHTPVTMEAGGRRHTVEISRRSLASAVQEQFDRLAHMARSALQPGAPARIVLSNRIAALPGIDAAIAQNPDSTIEALPVAAATLGAIRYASTISSPGEALPFITDLPVSPDATQSPRPSSDGSQSQDDSPDSPDSPDSVVGSSPTHIVVGGVAHPLSDRPLVLGIAIPSDCHGVNLTDTTGEISDSHCTISRGSEGVFVTDHSASGTFLNGSPVSGKSRLAVGDSLRLGSDGILIELISVVG
jgi:hypothetical protein